MQRICPVCAVPKGRFLTPRVSLTVPKYHQSLWDPFGRFCAIPKLDKKR